MSETDKSISASIGELTGEIRVMHQSTMDAIRVIREDLRRMEDSTRENMQHLENRIDSKIDKIGDRVSDLEAEDKKTIEKIAKHSAVGGIGGALVAGIIELINRIH